MQSYQQLLDQQPPSAPPPDYYEKETPQLQDTIRKMQSPEYVQAFDAKGLDAKSLTEGLKRVFGRYEIPVGLMSKLLEFKGAPLHFKIDDSGSMTNLANLLISDLSDHMKNKVGTPNDRKNTTRWEEAEDRLHILIDLLAYVPTGLISLSYFDRGQDLGQRIELDRRGKSPEDFLADAHKKISKLFEKEPEGGTPILENLQNMLRDADSKRKNADQKSMLYLLTDGEPSGGENEIANIKNLLKQRNAVANPVTFLGCSNRREDYAWMHEMEEVTKGVAALPDFVDERAEVVRDQGRGFPYSRGMWLLCNVAAALNPDDLDALDQHPPFTKKTLEDLLGRLMRNDEYNVYFNYHPNRDVFLPDYQQFLEYQSASVIGSVRLFRKVLADNLSKDMDEGDDNSEEEAVRIALNAVRASRRPQSGAMFNAENQYLLRDPQPASNGCCCGIL